MSPRYLVPLLAAALAATPLLGQETAPSGSENGRRYPTIPVIEAERAQCFPREENGVVYATIDPEIGGVTTRLYFRWDEDEDFYFVRMTPEGYGRYWGVPPRPKDENEGVEYYVALMDPLGEMVAKSEDLHSPVLDKGDCEVELTEHQLGEAENLTVGETTFEQVGEEVDGFLCYGVVTRINPDGVLRNDERCRACVIVWWKKPGFLLPAAAVLVGGIAVITGDEPREASPSSP